MVLIMNIKRLSSLVKLIKLSIDGHEFFTISQPLIQFEKFLRLLFTTASAGRGGGYSTVQLLPG